MAGGNSRSPTEMDPLMKQRMNQQRNIERYNKRKRYRKNCFVATIAIVVMIGCFGFFAYLRKHSDPNSSNELTSLLGRAREAKSLVAIDDETGVYSVDFDDVDEETTTFAELAQICLLPWYEASIMAVIDDPTWKDGSGILPSNVKNIRRVMLMARDMLDVFGPVFPDAPYPPKKLVTKKKKIHLTVKPNNGDDDTDDDSDGGDEDTKDRSLWRKLRVQYRDGYQKMGYLKDLDGLTYSQSLLDERVEDVLEWKKNFIGFQKKYRIRHFLYTKEIEKGGGIDPVGCYQHKSSHLFWADSTRIPCGDDLGTKSLQMVAVEQLNHSLEYLSIITNYTTVVPGSHEIQFHNLRKELRIFLDEYNLFGSILVPSTGGKDLKLSTSDHMNTVAGSSGSGSGSGTDETSTPAPTDEVVDDSKLLKEELTTLNKAQKMLGHINDQWTALEIYIKDGTHKSKQDTLKTTIDEMWMDFLTWQETNELEKSIKNILGRMDVSS